MNMQHLSVFKKIWFSLGILIIGYFISMVLGFVLGLKTESRLINISNSLLPASNHSQTAKNVFKEQAALYMDSILLGDPNKIVTAQDEAKEVEKELGKILGLPELDSESSKTINTTMADHRAYTEEAQKIYTAISKGDQSMMDKASALAQKHDALKNKLETIHQGFAARLQSELLSNVNSSRNQRLINLGIFLSVVILSLIFIALIIKRSIYRPLQQVAIAISEGAANVADASKQTSSAGQSLSEGASNQASAIEETSSSLTEMAAMIKQNALNAEETDNLVKRNNNEVLREANEAMGRLAQSIEDISGASEATRRIIKTIDEIAFQTNLLALNAAVEAARAGEAGAGFAVVADEVRSLAKRAADAAKETTKLIDNTIKTVIQGKEYTAATQSAFNKNMEQSHKATTLVSEIAAASQEQAASIEQMNRAMVTIDQVVQEMASHAEETANASEELSAQSGSMKNIVEELVSMLGMQGDKMMISSARKMQITEDPEYVKASLLQ